MESSFVDQKNVFCISQKDETGIQGSSVLEKVYPSCCLCYLVSVVQKLEACQKKVESKMYYDSHEEVRYTRVSANVDVCKSVNNAHQASTQVMIGNFCVKHSANIFNIAAKTIRIQEVFQVVTAPYYGIKFGHKAITFPILSLQPDKLEKDYFKKNFSKRDAFSGMASTDSDLLSRMLDMLAAIYSDSRKGNTEPFLNKVLTEWSRTQDSILDNTLSNTANETYVACTFSKPYWNQIKDNGSIRTLLPTIAKNVVDSDESFTASIRLSKFPKFDQRTIKAFIMSTHMNINSPQDTDISAQPPNAYIVDGFIEIGFGPGCPYGLTTERRDFNLNNSAPDEFAGYVPHEPISSTIILSGRSVPSPNNTKPITIYGPIEKEIVKMEYLSLQCQN